MKIILSIAVLLLNCSLPSHAQTYYKNSGYQWRGNEIIQGKYKATAKSATQVVSNYVPIEPKMEVWNDMNPKEINRREWNLHTDISHLPQYKSDNVLETALYNMALEESVLAIEPDSTFRTGIAWGGVWTRDVSYSIIHSLAQLHPEVAMKSLRAKVNSRNRIIQDTGTGGAWPCSTDRTIWAVAAWEVYKVTGNQQWLDYIYPIIRNTLRDDIAVAYDRKTHLMRGETSYMDWREQEYPEWMQPADIYSSEAMVNNMVHYLATRAMAQICTLKGFTEESRRWSERAKHLSNGMNAHLWMQDKGRFGIYLYGREFPILCQQSDVMGNALAILSEMTTEDQTKRISENVVSEKYGTPCLYPNLKDQYPYHNDATWPFVQGYWMRACARAKNTEGLLHSIGCLYRGAALWLSNEENYEISTGDYQLTKLNSPRQLWSVAAQAAIVPHIYFGIKYEADKLTFSPFVPKALKGNRTLSNFLYRQAILDMSIHGYGTQIKEFLLDGKKATPEIAGNLAGKHTIDITLDGTEAPKMQFTLQDNEYLPITPMLKQEGKKLTWEATEGSAKYEVLQNGKVVSTVTETSYTATGDGEYTVRGVAENGTQGYISEPISIHSNVKEYQAAKYGEPTGNYLDMTRTKNICVTIPIQIDEEGNYSIMWHYSNGAGPINTSNKCATRLMRVDDNRVAVVLPQRGENEWDKWGYSNIHTMHLTQGNHLVTLEFTDQTENMNLEFNCAHVDKLIVSKL